MAVAGFAVAAGAQQVPKVDAPATGVPVVVNPTFYLQAEAPTCKSLNTTSMAYSFSSDPDNIVHGATALQLMVTPPSDTLPDPILRVKAWNTSGALCETDVQLTVGDSVQVQTPAQSASVNDPFTLQASASTCGGSPTSSMAYSIDSDGDTMFTGQTSINTQVTEAAAGWHILRAKAWGKSGTYCETDVHVNETGTQGIVPPPNASSYAHLELDGTGPSYNCGANVPPDPNNWLSECDSGTPGTKSGSTTLVSSPVYSDDSQSREFTMNFSQSGSGERWFDGKAGDDSATHFIYDTWVYLPTNATTENIEMDVNHSIKSSGQVYILAAQCSLGTGTGNWGYWQVTSTSGWVQTNAPCNPSMITSGQWHHFQIESHHDGNGGPNIYYDAVAVDGNVTNITTCSKIGNPSDTVPCTNAVKTLNWGSTIGPNFQLDGQTASGYPNTDTAYVDDFTVYYW